MKIDLHTHTTCSDGTMTPTELVQHAIINGISIMGLTDHDTVAGWSEAVGALRGDFQLVLGSEISCLTDDGQSVHMLGLLFDDSYQPLQDALALSRDDRVPRMQKMIELMRADGIDISFDEVLKFKPEGATLGRPHLADTLVAKGLVKNRDLAFAEWLNNESKYYVSHIAPTPIEAIKLIKAAGGVSVIAHPYASLRASGLNVESFVELKKAGLNGIEVDHRDQGIDERSNLRAIAEELDLVTTGSSDFHGTGKLNLIGENVTAPEHWERLESMADQRRVVRKA
ncbi:MAG: PHP domain-containing protein [Candidatus Nanopelagicaceae bacterium]